jgi:hypothetical protein
MANVLDGFVDTQARNLGVASDDVATGEPARTLSRKKR